MIEIFKTNCGTFVCFFFLAGGGGLYLRTSISVNLSYETNKKSTKALKYLMEKYFCIFTHSTNSSTHFYKNKNMIFNAQYIFLTSIFKTLRVLPVLTQETWTRTKYRTFATWLLTWQLYGFDITATRLILKPWKM